MATFDSTPKTVEIQLTKGQTAIIDEVDSDLADFKWYATNRDPVVSYAARQVYVGNRRNRSLSMHRIILERILNRSLESGEVCDHINHNPRDNRRENLRLATVRENGQNRKRQKNSTTGFTGVYAIDGAFQSFIKLQGKRKYLGVYASAEHAYAAYCIAAREHFGKYANLDDEDKVRGIVPVRLSRKRGPKTDK